MEVDIMGRRRWRVVTVAAFLLFMRKDTHCQDENDFYYTPVERSFAQVQPPLYTNNRPTTYFEQEDPYRVGQPTIASPQQPLYSEGRVRFPSPNYNQNPSPFQLPTGRSQSGTQYYVNQPDFTPSQRQRYRLSLPHNYQVLHPASTKRPDISQIHSVQYQNDPSKPETFLGQVTINNPDIDFLQNSRFKNIPFDGNSLKNGVHTHHGLLNDEEDDNDNQDLFDQHRVTTYNPNNLSRPRIIKPNPGRFPHYEGEPSLNDQTLYQKTQNKINLSNNNFKVTKSSVDNVPYHDTSTEYKAMLDIEPLLEDDIKDISSFRELMKNKKESHDVQVIKSNNSYYSEKYDSNPSASSMNAGNVSNAQLSRFDITTKPSSTKESLKTTQLSNSNRDITNTQERDLDDPHENHDSENENQNGDGEEEYVEYYDESDTTETAESTTQKPQPIEHLDDYEEYDSGEEEDDEEEVKQEHPTEYIKDNLPVEVERDNQAIDKLISNDTSKQVKQNKTKYFEVLVMKPNMTLVTDDNFQQFIDTTVIDQIEHVPGLNTTETNTEPGISSEEIVAVGLSQEESTTFDTSSILGQEVVSVVTTKSVVNGTISVPNFTYLPTTTKRSVTSEILPSIVSSQNDGSTVPVTTQRVVASVQTSRSVSGARFLPFPVVEQGEKKQLLTDDESEESVTKNPKDELTTSERQQTPEASTENINDKLDSIQSELSSAVLSGSLDSDNKNIEIITESTTTKQHITTTTTTTPTTPITLNVFTIRSTEMTNVTEKSAPDPLPVLIKKFTPRVSTSTSTTVKPRKKLVTVMDELAPGLLPPGYKPRMSYKNKRTSTTSTTTTTTSTTTPKSVSSDEDIINGTQGRSSGISSKNKVIISDEKVPNVPKSSKPKEYKPRDDLFSKFQQDNLSKLLPPDYKPPATDSSESKDLKPSILDKVQQVDISSLLPKGFNLNTTTDKSKIILPKAETIDIRALLPPGYKLNSTEVKSAEIPINKVKIADISNLLPPGFNLNNSEDEVLSTTPTKVPSGGPIKLVFPSRPINKPIRKTATSKPVFEAGPAPVTPKIQKGWPTRASTEFTGWPSPSTTPFSIEKLLEAQRNATATSPMPNFSTEATTRRTTSTTTTTPVPTIPTTPGICKLECDIAATIKIISGVKWVPELLDHHTEEWQNLAREVKEGLNSVYSKSDLLNKWYKSIRIDEFTTDSDRMKRSVLVDYFIELNDVEEKVDTSELKKLFHKSLHKAKAGSVVEVIEEELNENEGFDPDVMLGDQPEEERMKKSNEKMTKTIDKSAGKLEIGKFVMDPAYTEFIVLPKREEITTVAPEEESFLPQWGIAVIVIAMASLLFVVIFGVTVLVNRQKSSKAKQPIPLSEDMLRELDKSHMGGFDDLHQLKERELPYHPPGKRMSTAFIDQLAYPNPGDSWRSEWTPQLQKYMQHYTPDSGRGSQIYGAGGNPYGYNGSQLYGQTGGGSQIYGYTGEYPPARSHYSRRRSEYDSNF